MLWTVEESGRWVADGNPTEHFWDGLYELPHYKYKAKKIPDDSTEKLLGWLNVAPQEKSQLDFRMDSH